MKLFLKVIFVVLLLANCGVFIVLYPQFDVAPTTASPAVQNALLESNAGEPAKIDLISEAIQPASELYIQPEILLEQPARSVSSDEDELFLVSPVELSPLKSESPE